MPDTMMGPGARPRFRLLHLMAMVAALALTLVVAPAFMKAVMRSFGPMASWNRFMYVDGVTTLALASWSIALAPAVLVANRRRLREAGRSYGTSAVLASGSSLVFLVGSKVVETLWRRWASGWSVGWRNLEAYLLILGGMLHEIPQVPAAAIVAVWSTLAMTGVGRKAAGWPEFACLSFGLCWIGWALVGRSMDLIDPPWLHGEVPDLW